MSRNQERVLKASTLACVISGCQGFRTTVELRNEAFVTGKVVDSDGYMNIDLSDAVFHDPQGNISRFSAFHVQGRLVRFVQIPPELNLETVLTTQCDILTGRAGRGRGRGRGEARTATSAAARHKIRKKEARHQEDLRNALKMKEENQRKSS